MSQDVIADALNALINAKRAGKKTVQTSRYSKVLLSILAIGKLKGYIKHYEVKSGILTIETAKLNNCRAVKPRYSISIPQIDRYVARYLPARNIGILILSTSQGLMTHQTAQEKNIGGSLIAFMY